MSKPDMNSLFTELDRLNSLRRNASKELDKAEVEYALQIDPGAIQQAVQNEESKLLKEIQDEEAEFQKVTAEQEARKARIQANRAKHHNCKREYKARLARERTRRRESIDSQLQKDLSNALALVSSGTPLVGGTSSSPGRRLTHGQGGSLSNTPPSFHRVPPQVRGLLSILDGPSAKKIRQPAPNGNQDSLVRTLFPHTPHSSPPCTSQKRKAD